MAFIPVPNGIQLCFLFGGDQQNFQFCLTLRKSAGAPEDTDLAQATADGGAWWTNNLKGLLGNWVTLKEIVATDLTSEGAPQNRVTVNETGTDASTSIPLSNAIVISHRTAKRGRSYRGRTYLSGWPRASLNTPNTITGAWATGVAGHFASLKTLLDGHGLDHVVASKRHNGAVTSPAEVNEVISYVVDTLVDSQRRRLSGRGT